MASEGADEAHEERENNHDGEEGGNQEEENQGAKPWDDDQEDEGEFIKNSDLGSLSLEEVLPGDSARGKFIKAQERWAWFIEKAGRRVEEIDVGEYDLYNENDDVVGPGMSKAVPRPQ